MMSHRRFATKSRSLFQIKNGSNRARSARETWRGQIEELESRLTPTTYVVDSNLDTVNAMDGVTTLREAIMQANSNPGADTIHFAIETGQQIIAVDSALPDVTESVNIDGATQPGYAGAPLIQIDGTNAGPLSSGITLVNHTLSRVIGLDIVGFALNGITIDQGGGYHRIQKNYIGVDFDGATPFGNASNGVFIAGGSVSNFIGVDGDGIGDSTEGNLISGNLVAGVFLANANTIGNHISGNLIGIDAIGSTAVPNNVGVAIEDGPTANIIGTNGDGVSDFVERNVISGNNSDGVQFFGAGTQNNRVAGNYLGVDITGTAALTNFGAGVHIFNSAKNNIVGTNGDGIGDNAEGNLISGNFFEGVWVSDPTTRNNRIAGNVIGLNAAGNNVIPNQFGVAFRDGADANTVGTNGDGVSDLEERNIIAGNSNDGVIITGLFSDNNVVAGNYIGVGADGQTVFANFVGVTVSGGALGARIGTNGNGVSDALERNVISGNLSDGVTLSANNGKVSGNYIGVDSFGFLPVANGGSGINVFGTNNTIGGKANVGEGNVVSGNAGFGVGVSGSNNRVSANIIGLDVAGLFAIPNSDSGVSISGNSNIIGANGNGISDEQEANLISGNLGNGVAIFGDSNVVASNIIGLDISGFANRGNGVHGVAVFSGTNNRIGTNGDGVSDQLETNYIGANVIAGVLLAGPSSIVAGNVIGGNADLSAALGNAVGIIVSSDGNRIGTNADGANDSFEANTIVGNALSGVVIQNGSNNVIAGNGVGTNLAGTLVLGNGENGVQITSDIASSGNTIGSNMDGAHDNVEANVIANNVDHGVAVENATSDRNLIVRNSMFSNGGSGIALVAGANNGQPAPVVASAKLLNSDLTLTFTLTAAANTTYQIDVYATDPGLAPAEGQRYLGRISVMTNGSGLYSGSETFAVIGAVALDDLVTATATDPVGNTSQFSTQVDVEPGITPRITGVWVSGAAWTANFKNFLQSQGVGSSAFGFFIPVGSSAQLTTVPWINLNRISVQFNEHVNITNSDLTLFGVNVATYTFNPALFTYDLATNTATWQLDASVVAAIGRDKLRIVIADTVVDDFGTQLDGEWVNSVSTYPSGDGQPGSAFRFRFNVVSGDFDRNGLVNAVDWNVVRGRLFQAVGGPNYSIFADMDGSGTINAVDWNTVRGRLFTSLPGGEPGGASAPTITLAPSLDGSSPLPTSVSSLAAGSSALVVSPASTLGPIVSEGAPTESSGDSNAGAVLTNPLKESTSTARSRRIQTAGGSLAVNAVDALFSLEN